MMRRVGLVIAVLGSMSVMPAAADQEASNRAHVVAGPQGTCYAKSVPEHVYDPDGGDRQAGRTYVYGVDSTVDRLLHTYDWYAQSLFVLCGPGDDVMVVRIGPWNRGSSPDPEHLALAFYRSGQLLHRYSTLDIALGSESEDEDVPAGNVETSVSHYWVFVREPQLVRIVTPLGPSQQVRYVVEAETVDGRNLTFNLETGEIER